MAWAVFPGPVPVGSSNVKETTSPVTGPARPLPGTPQKRTVTQIWIKTTLTPVGAGKPVTESCKQCANHVHVPDSTSSGWTRVQDANGNVLDLGEQFDPPPPPPAVPQSILRRMTPWHVSNGFFGTHFGDWFAGGTEKVDATRVTIEQENTIAPPAAAVWRDVNTKFEKDQKIRRLPSYVLWDKEDLSRCDIVEWLNQG